MGLRRKIKDRIRRLVGSDSKNNAPLERQSSQPLADTGPEPPVVSAPSEPVQPPLVPEPSPVPAAQEEGGSSVDQDKIAKHIARTKKGILKFVEKQGGSSSLADMHDHSEKRFFVGHKKFSDLMESMVEEGVLSYSWEEQRATLTAAGREMLSK